MTYLSDIFDPNDLALLIKEGYVRVQTHPTLPYTIYNYTEKAQFEHAWNDVTLACRGLIAHTTSGRIIARPFAKFFTIDQSDSPFVPDIPWNEAYRVYDKIDGSLGILYPTGGGEYGVASRGSFTSEQAVHATRVWAERYAHTAKPQEGTTYLFEIVYPDNRIVVDYKGFDDLVLIGCVNNFTGRTRGPGSAMLHLLWPGPVAEEYDPDVIHQDERPDREGYVLHFGESDHRVKVKHETYLNLHRIITNANTKNVWRAWAEGDLEAIYALPDEFREHIDRYLEGLEVGFNAKRELAEETVRIAAPYSAARDRAEVVIKYAPDRTVRAAAFAMLSGKTWEHIIKRSLEPDQAEPLWNT